MMIKEEKNIKDKPKPWYPKVGDKFYYRSSLDGEIKEVTCIKIEKKEGIMRKYYTSWENYKNGGSAGTFINECDILNPNSKRVQKYFKEKELKLNQEYWTEEHIKEIEEFIGPYVCYRGNYKEAFRNFIKNKLKK